MSISPFSVRLSRPVAGFRNRSLNENQIVGGVHFIILAIAAVFLFSNLNQRDLWASHEARAAQNAQLFLDNGGWGVLHLFDGSSDFQKPPFFYWLVAAIAWVRGKNVDEFAVRLPSAIAGWLIVFLVMRHLRNRGRRKAALIAGTVLLTAQHFLATSRTGRIDVPLTAAVTMSVFALINDRGLLGGLALAAGTLLKGPIGLICPFVIIGARRVCREKHMAPGLRVALRSVAIALAISAPWFLTVGFQTDWEYWRSFFWYHNVQRAAGTADELARHPFWYYLVRWGVDWLPWSPFLLMATFNAIRHQMWRTDSELGLGLAWFGAVTAMLSFARFKRADYLILAYPGAAIVLGCFAESVYLKMDAARRSPTHRGFALISMSSLIVCSIIEICCLPALVASHPQRGFASTIRHFATADRTIVFFRTEDHLLAYHVKPPLVTVKEWENLDVWIERLRIGFIVMPDREVAEWPRQLKNGTLHEVARMNDPSGRDRPRTWVLMQSRAND